MTFLPIVERELRLAARRRVTFWLRIVAALTAFVIASGLFTLLFYVPGGGGMQPGAPLFAVLTWMSLAVSLSAGLFFTADALSEEKREGTLGFLFLTDLRGYDVVLGKLFATSCRCVFALLAIFPILACTQLFGGVAAGQFWRTILALMHTLFFSLAAGMFVSSLSRHPQKALAGTFALLFLLLAGGAVVDGVIAGLSDQSFKPWFSLVSPITAFIQANGTAKAYWLAFGVGQMMAWSMLIAACWLVPRNWQDQARLNVAASPWRSWWRFGSVRQRRRFRADLLDRNPMTWLACRERWQSRLMWMLVAIVVVEFFLTSLFDNLWYHWIGWATISGLTGFFLYLWMVSQACQFFSELRRAGVIELLLAAPLDFQKVTLGAWLGLVRVFGLPVGIILLVQFLTEATGLNAARMGGMPTVQGEALPGWVQTGFTGVCNFAASVMNLIALSWFGLWMGLTSRNSLIGTLKTIVFVQIIPWLAIGFVSAMAVPIFIFAFSGNAGGAFVGWYPLVVTGLATLLSIGKDVGFWYVARKKLGMDFRATATRAVLPVNPMAMLPPVITLPPVVSPRT